MQKIVSTNLHIPEELWKEVKVHAAREGKSMREIILKGIRLALGKKESSKEKPSAASFLLKFSGKSKIKIKDGSKNHDRYIYD